MDDEEIYLRLQYPLFIEPIFGGKLAGRFYFLGTRFDSQLNEKFLKYYDGRGTLLQFDRDMTFRSCISIS